MVRGHCLLQCQCRGLHGAWPLLQCQCRGLHGAWPLLATCEADEEIRAADGIGTGLMGVSTYVPFTPIFCTQYLAPNFSHCPYECPI